MKPHLTTWTHPGAYAGFNPEGHILAATKHRESSILEESNYAIASQRLLLVAMQGANWMRDVIPRLEDVFPDAGPFGSGLDPDQTPTLYTWTASCSLVGWIEYLMIRPCRESRAIVFAARLIAKELYDYPVLCDEDYSDRQIEAMENYWKREPIKDRAQWCKENGASIFAARKPYPPREVEEAWGQEMFV